jgi:murein L,D-transpeptidase YcbB/YkuD
MGLHVSYSGGEVQITQPPGDGNALGRIRFNFQSVSVYQHDTPDKQLFAGRPAPIAMAACAYRSKYAEVLSTLRGHTSGGRRRIKNMFGSASARHSAADADLGSPLYQTAFVDTAGKLQFRRDVYNVDSRTLAAIKSHRGIVEPTPQRKREQQAASGSGPNGSTRWARVGASSQPPGFTYR